MCPQSVYCKPKCIFSFQLHPYSTNLSSLLNTTYGRKGGIFGVCNCWWNFAHTMAEKVEFLEFVIADEILHIPWPVPKTVKSSFCKIGRYSSRSSRIQDAVRHKTKSYHGEGSKLHVWHTWSSNWWHCGSWKAWKYVCYPGGGGRVSPWTIPHLLKMR